MATLEPFEIAVLEYETLTGRKLFSEWLADLRDRQGAAIILARIKRLRRGLFGHHRNIGHGVWELKVSFGPGYRVYYLFDGPQLIILLCGGDKSSQKYDIEQAKRLSLDYWRRKS